MSDPLQGLHAVPWHELRHAYGPAADIPTLLTRVARATADSDTWLTLYSSLAHQGTVYPASACVRGYAAEALACFPIRARQSGAIETALDIEKEPSARMRMRSILSNDEMRAVQAVASCDAFWRTDSDLPMVYGLPPGREAFRAKA
jgi:hypothetical protein